MIVEVYQAGLPIEYIVFDTLYTAGWLTKKINRRGLKWVGVLHPNTTVYYRHRRYIESHRSLAALFYTNPA